MNFSCNLLFLKSIELSACGGFSSTSSTVHAALSGQHGTVLRTLSLTLAYPYLKTLIVN